MIQRLTNIRRTYPADSFVFRVINGEGDRLSIMYRKFNDFQDNLNAMHRFRIYVPAVNMAVSANDETELIEQLKELAVDDRVLEAAIEKMAVEAAMLVHMKIEAMNKYLDEDTIEKGKIEYTKVNSAFDKAKEEGADALTALLNSMINEEPLKPSLTVVEETDET